MTNLREIKPRVRTSIPSRTIPRLDRFTGCLLGTAIGDAMGMPVETWNREKILAQFGRIRGFEAQKNHRRSKAAGSWTDDTYMMMLTARSIIESGGIDIDHMTARYFDALDNDFGIAGTTRQALTLRRSGQDIASLEKGRHSGSGSAVRIGPVALFGCSDLQALTTKASLVARITHVDNDAVAGAVATALAIGWAARGELEPQTLIGNLTEVMKTLRSNLTFTLPLVTSLLARNLPIEDAIEEIGTDGTTVRLVPSAFYAFLKNPEDFPETILGAVNAGGDTDSRAAIAGAISGTYNGESGIPRKWVRALQDNGAITRYATNLEYLTGAGII